MIDDEMDRHLEEWHTFDKGAVAEMVAEHRAMVEVMPDITMMVVDLYGKPRPTPADPDAREGGRFERYDEAVTKINNGGLRIQVPGWMVTVAVATLGMLGVILSAVIVAVWGGS